MALSKKTQAAIAKYGRETCEKAVRLSRQGEGAATVGAYLKLTTRQADAAINAGEEIAKAANEWQVLPYMRGFVVMRGVKGEALNHDGFVCGDATRRDCFFVTEADARAAIAKAGA